MTRQCGSALNEPCKVLICRKSGRSEIPARMRRSGHESAPCIRGNTLLTRISIMTYGQIDSAPASAPQCFQMPRFIGGLGARDRMDDVPLRLVVRADRPVYKHHRGRLVLVGPARSPDSLLTLTVLRHQAHQPPPHPPPTSLDFLPLTRAASPLCSFVAGGAPASNVAFPIPAPIVMIWGLRQAAHEVQTWNGCP